MTCSPARKIVGHVLAVWPWPRWSTQGLSGQSPPADSPPCPPQAPLINVLFKVANGLLVTSQSLFCHCFFPLYFHQYRPKSPSLLPFFQADLTSTSLPNSVFKASSSHVEANSYILVQWVWPSLLVQHRPLRDRSVLTLSP
jgi:hypothetical protein